MFVWTRSHRGSLSVRGRCPELLFVRKLVWAGWHLGCLAVLQLHPVAFFTVQMPSRTLSCIGTDRRVTVLQAVTLLHCLRSLSQVTWQVAASTRPVHGVISYISPWAQNLTYGCVVCGRSCLFSLPANEFEMRRQYLSDFGASCHLCQHRGGGDGV